MSDTPPLIVSEDVKRSRRVPPGQFETPGWPVLHVGPTPKFDPAQWSFRVFGLVEREWECSYEDFQSLPRVRVRADMHCVTTWSTLDNVWEGVPTREVLGVVKVLPAARFVMVHCEH